MRHFAVGGHDVACFAVEVDEFLDVTPQKRGHEEDRRLPGDVPDERTFGEAVDERKHFRQHHDLGHHQRANEPGDEDRRIDVILPQHQCLCEGEQLECEEEKQRGRNHLPDQMLHPLTELAHGKPLSAARVGLRLLFIVGL